MKDILKALLKTVSALNRPVDAVTMSDEPSVEKTNKYKKKQKDFKNFPKNDD